MSNAAVVDRLRLPVLPLRDVVVYPHMVIPLFVGREKSMRALELARPIFIRWVPWPRCSNCSSCLMAR